MYRVLQAAAILVGLLALESIGHEDGDTTHLKLQYGGFRLELDDAAGIESVSLTCAVNDKNSELLESQGEKHGKAWLMLVSEVDLSEGDILMCWIYQTLKGGRQIKAHKRWIISRVAYKYERRDTTAAGDEKWKGKNLKLVMNDDFNGALDTNKWDHAVTLSGGGNWEFEAYTNLKDNSFTRDGVLFLKPTLTADKYGEAFLTTKVWDVKAMYGKCTDDKFWGCLRDGKKGFLNPVLSAKLQSKASIKYGKVEIRAKMPRGDWLWPALWMLPDFGKRGGTGVYGGWPQSGEIDIMESRGNRNYGNLGVQYMSSTLHWGSAGINRYTMTTKSKKSTKGTLADGYHTYTFYWDESELKFMLDGEEVMTVPTPPEGFFKWGKFPGNDIWKSKNGPFDQKFYLIMNVAVGGTNGFFPDNVPNGTGKKPWSNKDSNGPQKFWQGKNTWYPTWKGDDAAMQVDYVRMWQLQ